MLTLPTHVEHNGVEYPINTHYTVALECFDIINDDDLVDWERSVAVVTLLFGGDIPVDEHSLKKAQKYLEVGNDEDDDKEEAIIDFGQHREYIYASFKEQYPTVDMVNLHWWEFISLFKGLSPDTVIGRIQELLSADPFTIDDQKERQKLIKSQNKFKIKRIDKKLEKELKEKEDEFMRKLYRKGG